MANSNFIVQNGLTVGPLTIDAVTGNITTSGTITTTGSGSISSANGFGGLNPDKIYNGSSNVNVTSTQIFGNISGTNVLTITSSGMTVAGSLTVTGTTTTINSTTLDITDLNITVAKGAASSAAADGGGITVEGASATWTWNNSASAWQSNKTIVPSANASLNLGSSSAWWGTLFGVSTQAKYADLAENYQADAHYHPGTVLEFGGSEEVTIAVEGTRRVAGVVSTNPAHVMNGGLTGPNVATLALTGRVPCNVIGPVAKGDLMVSAGFGYAKANNDPAIGQVIGKALADFTGAKGQIEVVVGRF